MGAPKQKWTPEEEAALKAGVLKHGPGKWRTILKDQEFSGVLYLRSNVDLKDKWRNMSVIANGWGSREKARLAVKRMQQLPKKNENSFALMSVTQSGEAIVGSPKGNSSKRSIIRLDNLILEAINNLKEPGGSNKTNIGSYIEEQYWAPPNFERLLSAKLKFLTASGKLIKMKRKYSIVPTSAASEKRGHPSMLLLEGRQRDSPRDNADDDGFTTMKSGIEADIAKMRSMTTMEAAAVAAKAISEAEFALAQAKQAAREAEEAEADAEAAQAFAEAVEEALQDRSHGEPLMT